MPLIQTRGVATVAGFRGQAPNSVPGVQPSLLMHFDGTNGSTAFVDQTGKPLTASPTGASISTAQSVFGPSSGLFANGIVTAPNGPDFQFGTGDFTIDCWLRPTAAITNFQEFVSKGAGLQMYLNTGNVVGVAMSVNNSAASYFINQQFGTIVPNTWTHVAFVKQGNVYSGYVNGVRGMAVTNANSMGTGLDVFMLGDWSGRGSFPYPYMGYMDELRVVKGLALFSGASFAVPTEPYVWP